MAGQGFGEVARNEIVKVKRLMVLLLLLGFFFVFLHMDIQLFQYICGKDYPFSIELPLCLSLFVWKYVNINVSDIT